MKLEPVDTWWEREGKDIAGKIGPDELAEGGKILLDHPLTARFALKAQAAADNRVRTPDDVLGERMMRVGALMALEANYPGNGVLMNCTDDRRNIALVSFAEAAISATPYLIAEPIRQQIGHTQIPPHVLSPRLLPEPKMWLTFETGVGVGDFTFDFLVLTDAVEGFLAITGGEKKPAGPNEPGKPVLFWQQYNYGSVWPDDHQQESQNLQDILQLLSFIQSPYIPKQRYKASRAARRETLRASADPVEDDIVFVTLRRAAPANSHDTQETNVNWKHRWIVSGHLRAQWYPSERAHHLIWIAPHIKGPEDAPLLQHVYNVSR